MVAFTRLKTGKTGKVHEYTLLAENAFNSTRKRMSVLVRTPEGKIMLYCKGADSAIFSRLRLRSEDERATLERTQHKLDGYARLGLRVLVMAKRDMGEAEYAAWAAQHSEAEVGF